MTSTERNDQIERIKSGVRKKGLKCVLIEALS
jgi:hypothetical protein